MILQLLCIFSIFSFFQRKPLSRVSKPLIHTHHRCSYTPSQTLGSTSQCPSYTCYLGSRLCGCDALAPFPWYYDPSYVTKAKPIWTSSKLTRSSSAAGGQRILMRHGLRIFWKNKLRRIFTCGTFFFKYIYISSMSVFIFEDGFAPPGPGWWPVCGEILCHSSHVTLFSCSLLSFFFLPTPNAKKSFLFDFGQGTFCLLGHGFHRFCLLQKHMCFIGVSVNSSPARFLETLSLWTCSGPVQHPTCWMLSGTDKFIFVSSEQKVVCQCLSGSFSCSWAKLNIEVLWPVNFFLDSTLRSNQPIKPQWISAHLQCQSQRILSHWYCSAMAMVSIQYTHMMQLFRNIVQYFSFLFLPILPVLQLWLAFPTLDCKPACFHFIILYCAG